MTTKAIITRRRTPRSDATAAIERIEAEKLGLSAEHQLPSGTLIRGKANQYAALEAQGYRVKLLKDTNILKVGAYQIDIEKGPPKVPQGLEVPPALKSKWTHHLVQLAAPPNADWIRAIEQHGIDVVEPLSAYGLFVVGNPEQVKKLEELPMVEWTGPFKPAYRLSPNLKGLKGKIKYVNIGVYPAAGVIDVRKVLEKAGAVVVNESSQMTPYKDLYSVLLVEMDAARIADVATLPAVRWLEFQGPPTPTDERSNQIVAENLDDAAPPNTAPVVGYQATVTNPDTGLGLSGTGVIIGICDTGIDNHDSATMHPDLRNRMAFFANTTENDDAVDTSGHGTHVAGIAVGNGASGDIDPQGFLLGVGIAPAAEFGSVNAVVAEATTGPADWVRQVSTHGGQVMNNSWEFTPTAGDPYSAEARSFDLRVRDPDPGTAGLENLAIVFAAGNNGPELGTISSPAMAKNLIVVGNSLNFRPGEGDAIDDIRGLRSDSGRGLTSDGRISPTIVAPGTTIISARSTEAVDDAPYVDTGNATHDNHTRKSGTSMAAPHVSGLCALLIEWWRSRTGGRNPSPALLKALLINGAIDIVGGDTRRTDNGNPVLIANIPNGDQGWGRVSLQNIVVQAPNSDRGPKIFSDQRHAFTADGQEFTIRVAAADPARPLRITVVWTDAAGAAFDDPALVNDLDLAVTELATEDVFKGNNFEDGFSITGGDFKSLDNVECVYIQNPNGTYEVTIIASSIAASAHPGIATPWQDFALVIDNAEVPATAPVSVVPVIDRSSSMVSFGYVDVTRTSSKQFVDLMSVDDQLGVVSFGSTSSVEFPTGASPTLRTITSPDVREDAKAEIDGITFSGCTFMGAGINAARDLLSSASGSRAIVLLSDGYDNKGCDESNPAKPSALEAATDLPDEMPVFACAMGPTSDQDLLAQIAEVSNGRYYYMPSIDDLFEIYNFIRGQVSGDAIIVNESAMASSSRVEAFVDALATQATFTVAWLDTKLRFVGQDPKKSNEVSIRLRDPRGKLLHPSDSYIRRIVGQGYVVFKIQEPMPGRWHVEVSTFGEAHVRYTVGGFVTSPLRLFVRSLNRLAPGAALNVASQVFDGKSAISGFRATKQIVRPSLSVAGLLKKFKTKLRDIRPSRLPGGDTIPRDIAKLVTLRAQMLKARKPDPFTHKVDLVTLRNASASDLSRLNLGPLTNLGFADAEPRDLITSVSGGHLSSGAQAIELAAAAGILLGQFTDTTQAGSYNVIVNASGASPLSGTRFVRKGLVSVLVK